MIFYIYTVAQACSMCVCVELKTSMYLSMKIIELARDQEIALGRERKRRLLVKWNPIQVSPILLITILM